jgi:CheY-like chemotaxis protein
LGLHADAVVDGAEAIASLETLPYDLVLMDVQMPEMDGFEATSIIRQTERESGGHVPIVAMTGRAMKGDREQCLAAGMNTYVPKPVRPEDMRTIVERWGSAAGMPDLAFAMKANPHLKVQLHGGYFDLATLYYAAEFEFKHMPIPPELRSNLEVKRYQSGHMIYLHEASRAQIHDNIADFMRRTHTP